MKIRSLAAILLATAGLSTVSLVSLAVVPQAAGAAVTCPTAAVITSIFGKTVSAPSSTSSSSNGETGSGCSYSTTSGASETTLVSVTFETPATSSAWNTLLKQYKNGNPSTKSVSGIGNAAFTYDITDNYSSTCSNGVCKTTNNPNAKPINYIDAWKSGSAIIEISGGTSSVTIAQLETLAKKLA